MLSKSDGSLVGVVSNMIYSDSLRTQEFTNLPYYYQWIEQRTGLRLPKCDGRQAYRYPEISKKKNTPTN